MATFTADEYGSIIENCWLDGRDVTNLTTQASITAASTNTNYPPPSGVTEGLGWIDLLDTDDEDHFVAGADGEPVATRHYGIVRLEWKNV